MAQTHINRILADWSVGAPAPATLSDLGLENFEAALLALDEQWLFVRADRYCPWVDTPSYAKGLGVWIQGGNACIVADNGLALVCWLLLAPE